MKRAATIFLSLAVLLTFTPFVGQWTGGTIGAEEACAADTEALSGEVNTSELTQGGAYELSGDTTIYVDASIIISSVDVKGYTLTIEVAEGHEEDILSVWGSGIKGYQGNVILNSGSLDLDLDGDTGYWTSAVGLTLGSFTMNGGGLFIRYGGRGTYSSYGINTQSFTMNGGTANIRCETKTSGSAVGIAVNDFTMTGGDLSVDAVTTVSGQSAYGIEAYGATSDSDFYMSGGTLGATGTADSEGYGINWTADKTKNSFVVEGGNLTAEGVKNGINSWVPVTISGGADVTAQSTNSAAMYTDGATITISGVGSKLTAESTNADAIDAYNATIEMAGGVEIVQPERGYVANYGGSSQSIKDDSDEWAKKVVIAGINEPIAVPTGKTLIYTGKSLTGVIDGTGYTVSGTKSAINAGTYEAIVTPVEGYCWTDGTTDAKTVSWEINPKEITPKVTAADKTYTGKVLTPVLTVKDGTKTLTTANYTRELPGGRKNVGKYKVTVNMRGNYTGTATTYFKINPKGTSLKSLTAGSKSITVKWNKQATKMSTSYITGYQIQIATNSKFTTGVKNYTATKYSTVSKKLTKLKGKKKYYVRIRTYKTVSGTKYYSPWSKSKYVTTKK